MQFLKLVWSLFPYSNPTYNFFLQTLLLLVQFLTPSLRSTTFINRWGVVNQKPYKQNLLALPLMIIAIVSWLRAWICCSCLFIVLILLISYLYYNIAYHPEARTFIMPNNYSYLYLINATNLLRNYTSTLPIQFWWYWSSFYIFSYFHNVDILLSLYL